MSILSKLKDWFTTTENDIEEVLTPFDHLLLEKFHPLFQQIETTLGQQGIQIVEDALTGVMGTIASGGDVSAGIAAAAKEALSQIEADAPADAKNAVYGLLAATVATLPTQSTPTAA